MNNPASRLVLLDDERPYLNSLIGEVMGELDDPQPWYATGLPTLDRLLDGGVRGGDLFVVAARPRIGKSALALQMVIHAAERGIPVAVWSLEMRPKSWVRRALASLSGVTVSKMRRGEVGDMETENLAAAADAFQKLPIFWPSIGNTTPAGLAKEAAHQIELRDIKVIVVDYLSLLQSDEGSYSREQEVAAHCRNLKAIANRHDVAVITLAQLNRDADGKVPTLATLRESGEIEASADEVLFLHRKPNEENGLLENEGMGILAKNRDGASGAFPLRYDWRRYSFDEIGYEAQS